MAIYIKSPPPAPPQIPDINPQMIAGRSGAFPAGEMETVDDLDLAPVGPYVVRKGSEAKYPKGTKNIPPGAAPYGTVLTVSSAGAGQDGKRCITKPLTDNEFVYQIFFDTTLALFTRSGFGKTGFTVWQRKTPKR
ncbi:TPA_asm: hypothetical protein GBZ67_22375 [Salmonella enterica subsp. diarizonae]|nr:hypothetical protein [Salmonella enterica subsp. diarizonae]ELI2368416.1 hypothetical protein [Salmonella enterica]HAB1617070.1 hypothetical protein [Salmonella enterica subsp. diarizonae]